MAQHVVRFLSVVFELVSSGRMSALQLAFILDVNSTDEMPALTNVSAVGDHGFSHNEISNLTRFRDEVQVNRNHASRSIAQDSEEDGEGQHFEDDNFTNASNSSQENRSSREWNLSADKANIKYFIAVSNSSIAPLAMVFVMLVLCMIATCYFCRGGGGKHHRKKGFIKAMGSVLSRHGRSEADNNFMAGNSFMNSGANADDDKTSTSEDGAGRKHKGFLAKGKESRGVEANAKYKFGDLSRGVIKSAKQGIHIHGHSGRSSSK